MEINASIQISRNSRDGINIEITDEKSRTRFVQMELTLEQFALAITNLYTTNIKASVCKLDTVGKEKYVEDRQVVCPSPYYTSTDHMVNWLKENCQEHGYELDTYLGSRNSISNHESGGCLIKYRVIRYE